MFCAHFRTGQQEMSRPLSGTRRVVVVKMNDFKYIKITKMMNSFVKEAKINYFFTVHKWEEPTRLETLQVAILVIVKYKLSGSPLYRFKELNTSTVWVANRGSIHDNRSNQGLVK